MSLMENAMQAKPKPIGVLHSATVFGAFSLLLWVTVDDVIPWLHRAFGLSPIIGWYLSGTVLVLLPILAFGWLMACFDLRTRNFRQVCKRLRICPLNRGDIVWTVAGLVTMALASFVILVLARRIDPSFRPSPEFLRQGPGWHAWVFLAWIPLFISNIVGEEVCWRGYVLPRQEVASGRTAWLQNGIMWCLFHWSFGWSVMIVLLPITMLLPWIVQRRRNTSVGMIIHAAFNAAGFIVAISGRNKF